MKKATGFLLGILLCLWMTLPVCAEQAEAAFDDPYYHQQWALEAIDWLPVWQQGLTGKGVKIGIIDSGTYAAHEDLQGVDMQGGNFNNSGPDESEDFTKDVIGHGTFVTGIIAAQQKNGKGIVGIAPNAEIYAYRAFSEKEGSVLTMLHALEQAIADGCQIVNLSMGTSTDSSKLLAGIQKAQAAGVLVVAAVGNGIVNGMPDLTATFYPAGYEGVIGVGSVNQQLERSSFSQTNESVFVMAPGQALTSLSHTNPSGYVSGSGTSYATPIVTALAALALEYDPTLTPAEIAEMLRLTAVDLGEPGYDTSYGYGLVNAAALIEGLKSHFSVRYQLMGGAFSEDIPLFYPVSEGLYQLPAPVCEGHSFVGWYSDADRTVPVEQFAAGTMGAQTLYAKWKADGAGLCSDEAGDGDHLCEICGADGASACADDDKDHSCDECTAVLSEHMDDDSDHACDWCGETLSACQDGDDQDTLCDVCGKDLFRFVAAEDAVKILDAPENLMVLVALYDGGKMVSVQMVSPAAEQRKEFTIPITPGENTRIFFLDKDSCAPYLQQFTSQMSGR
ncbi:MAG: S8 family serine peptidase [Clostridia bacterium]|nr:S8 family serine peptidase [Clostridia bacterium]